MSNGSKKRKLQDETTSILKPIDSSNDSLYKKSRFFEQPSLDSEPPLPPLPNTSPSSTSLPSTSPQSSHTSLQDLLDCTTLTQPNYISRFNDISRSLLHHHQIVLKCGDTETRYQILELEVYFRNEGHEDPFTHGSEEQKVSGTWYFHRAPRRSADSTRSATSLTGYRGGSRKGLDLTLGNPIPSSISSTSLLRGGILLRSIRRLGDASAVVSGPSLLVDEVLSRSKVASITELVQTKWGGDTSAFSDPSKRETVMYLEPITLKDPPRIYQSPRIGLDLSHPGVTFKPTDTHENFHPRIKFLLRPYRYFTHPNELTSNGRPQTLLGIFEHLLSELQSTSQPTDSNREKVIRSGVFVRRLSETMSLQEKSVQKYIDAYEAGRLGGIKALEGFIGPKGKGKASSPVGWLTLAGALDTVTGREVL
ncbi:hypothetical protein BDQ17DRAFT_1361695 [Cyathus striatus]|nr:hypothetical protein BDQ17DRAFT_1361695 [Cyathus striatus]